MQFHPVSSAAFHLIIYFNPLSDRYEEDIDRLGLSDLRCLIAGFCFVPLGPIQIELNSGSHFYTTLIMILDSLLGAKTDKRCVHQS